MINKTTYLNNINIKYRPEIDGLRAIAVIAVIFYHFQINIYGFEIFNGGYIGVDIFFVISGYLISSLIFKELFISEKFSINYFYERRIRRILPLLLFVILLCLPFAWFLILPGSFISFAESIISSLFFFSNFYFHYSGTTYGAESSLIKPFLHTWSLSVEEQFYILFPLFFVVIYKFFKKYFFFILVVFFLISLFIAEWGSRNHSSFNFYVLPTRAWELITGSLLAYLEIKFKKKNISKYYSFYNFIGLFIILFSFFLFDNKIRHPSLYTLFPVLGVILIIWFSNTNSIVYKILSSKVFVFIGLISYSLYIWHYPILAFDNLTQFSNNNLFLKIALIILVFFLSCLSYFLIEKTFRNKKFKFRYIFFYLLTFYIIIIIFSFSVIINEGFKNRYTKLLHNLDQQPWSLLKNSINQNCHNNNHICEFNKLSTKEVIVIGDSHLSILSFDLKTKVVHKDYKFISSTNDGCIYIPNFNRVDKNKKIDKRCNKKYFKKIKKILNKSNDSIIILGGRFPKYLSNNYFDNKEGGVEGNEYSYNFINDMQDNKFENEFINEVKKLSNKNYIILIYPIPEVGFNVPEKIRQMYYEDSNLLNKNIEDENFLTTSYEVYLERSKSSFELFDKIDSKNIFRVYPHKLFCNTIKKDRCLTHNNEYIFYSDDDHPSIKGAELINNLILKKLNDIEKRNAY